MVVAGMTPAFGEDPEFAEVKNNGFGMSNKI
jgi:hypothetical protein